MPDLSTVSLWLWTLESVLFSVSSKLADNKQKYSERRNQSKQAEIIFDLYSDLFINEWVGGKKSPNLFLCVANILHLSGFVLQTDMLLISNIRSHWSASQKSYKVRGKQTKWAIRIFLLLTNGRKGVIKLNKTVRGAGCMNTFRKWTALCGLALGCLWQQHNWHLDKSHSEPLERMQLIITLFE